MPSAQLVMAPHNPSKVPEIPSHKLPRKFLTPLSTRDQAVSNPPMMPPTSPEKNLPMVLMTPTTVLEMPVQILPKNSPTISSSSSTSAQSADRRSDRNWMKSFQIQPRLLTRLSQAFPIPTVNTS